MPNMPAPEQDTEPTSRTALVERIEAGRNELTLAGAPSCESQDIASIFGWAY